MTETITIRRAEPSDLEAVAALRRQWMLEDGDTATTLERPAFISHFVAWAAENSASRVPTRASGPVRPARWRTPWARSRRPPATGTTTRGAS